MTAKRRKAGQVSVCFFGDGALNQGLLLESMNMASIWQLPVIYVCENNQYGEYTPTERVTGGTIPQRGEALGVTSVSVDGMDVMAVYDAARQMVERARSGEGPGFLVCQTYRYFGHGMSDRDRTYRTRDEEDNWRRKDPIERLAHSLIDSSQFAQSELTAIQDKTHTAAREFTAQDERAADSLRAVEADLPTR